MTPGTALEFDHNLTGNDTPMMQRAAMTHAGMAHFAGTGPAGKTCRQCAYWAASRDTVATAKTARCAKTAQLSHGKKRQAFPSAPACRHFEVRG